MQKGVIKSFSNIESDKLLNFVKTDQTLKDKLLSEENTGLTKEKLITEWLDRISKKKSVFLLQPNFPLVLPAVFKLRYILFLANRNEESGSDHKFIEAKKFWSKYIEINDSNTVPAFSKICIKFKDSDKEIQFGVDEAQKLIAGFSERKISMADLDKLAEKLAETEYTNHSNEKFGKTENKKLSQEEIKKKIVCFWVETGQINNVVDLLEWCDLELSSYVFYQIVKNKTLYSQMEKIFFNIGLDDWLDVCSDGCEFESIDKVKQYIKEQRSMYNEDKIELIKNIKELKLSQNQLIRFVAFNKPELEKEIYQKLDDTPRFDILADVLFFAILNSSDKNQEEKRFNNLTEHFYYWISYSLSHQEMKKIAEKLFTLLKNAEVVELAVKQYDKRNQGIYNVYDLYDLTQELGVVGYGEGYCNCDECGSKFFVSDWNAIRLSAISKVITKDLPPDTKKTFILKISSYFADDLKLGLGDEELISQIESMFQLIISNDNDKKSSGSNLTKLYEVLKNVKKFVINVEKNTVCSKRFDFKAFIFELFERNILDRYSFKFLCSGLRDCYKKLMESTAAYRDNNLIANKSEDIDDIKSILNLERFKIEYIKCVIKKLKESKKQAQQSIFKNIKSNIKSLERKHSGTRSVSVDFKMRSEKNSDETKRTERPKSLDNKIKRQKEK